MIQSQKATKQSHDLNILSISSLYPVELHSITISGREWLERLADNTRLRWIRRMDGWMDVYSIRFSAVLLVLTFSILFSDLPSLSLHSGRLEDSLLGGGGSSKRNADTLGLGTGKRSGIMWNNFSGHHAFTTGRGGRSSGGGGNNADAGPFMATSGKSGRPKGPSQTLKVSAS